ncbi:glycine zipper 2TM domain-containing protein [Piscinibacter sp.]|jgi:outer membrane lipoprotein SlyB|uniref:glycine zipper 2TM domain-containing protein n=1 Tax=Piscinibacter sp. TaxID=1903157 RepID=UPI002F4164E5
MATLRQVIVGVLATLLVWITAPALAQPGRSAAEATASLHVDAFDVEEVPQLSSGTPLNFSLYGTPGAAATLLIDGAQRSLDLHEVQPGIYEGTYTIDAQDQIGPDSRVTAILRRGNQVARSVLAEPLLLGASAPIAAGPPMAQSAPIDDSPPIATSPRIGTPVPPAPAAPACADCAVVESVRAVELGSGRGYLGAITGGLVGAILGNQVGRGEGRSVARIIGALGGALAGRELERKRSWRTRYDVVLRLPNGAAQTRSYDSMPPFKVGDTVRLGAATLARAERSAPPF